MTAVTVCMGCEVDHPGIGGPVNLVLCDKCKDRERKTMPVKLVTGDEAVRVLLARCDPEGVQGMTECGIIVCRGHEKACHQAKVNDIGSTMDRAWAAKGSTEVGVYRCTVCGYLEGYDWVVTPEGTIRSGWTLR